MFWNVVMYLGIDLGTSGLKAALMDDAGNIIDTKSAALSVNSPNPLWSEQNPLDWWSAVESVIDQLSQSHIVSQIKAIGLSGQMHGATLLDEAGSVIRPAILWNDGRCQAECLEIEGVVSDSRRLTGNIMMPGFTAPKLLWVKNNEPKHFERIHKVLLPKDYLRFRLCGTFFSDMSDASGTMWMNTRERCWDESLLAACGLTKKHMPELVEGPQVTGTLLPELARKWGMDEIPIVAGAGDNAAGAIGVGLTEPGQGMISLGTSGVYFVVADQFSSFPEKAVHSFCHALPDRWHLMSVMLSAANCLDWFAKSVVGKDVPAVLSLLENEDGPSENAPFFLPYLSGERTPHNDPNASGAFIGLTHQHSTKDMAYAVLEGVCFAMADGVDAVHASGTSANDICLIGGGTKSAYWRQMMADILNLKLSYKQGGDVGPALGAARLAQLGTCENSQVQNVCGSPPLVDIHNPNAEHHQIYQRRRNLFVSLYPAIQQAVSPLSQTSTER